MDAFNWNIAESLEDNPIELNQEWNGRQGSVFLIECSEEMLEKQGSEASYFQLCMMIIKEIMSKAIIARSTECFGIAFYGTALKDKPTNPDNIWTFHEVQQPSAEGILKIEEILEYSFDDFNNKFGVSSNFSIADSLWHCSSLLLNSSFKFRGQKIILATSNHHPHHDNANAEHQVRKRAADLLSAKIDLQLLPFGASFDISRFYQEILLKFTLTEELLPLNITDLDSALSQLTIKDSKLRSFGHMNFYLKNDLYFGVSVFKQYRKVTIPTSTKLHRVHNEPIKTITKLKEAETNEIMLPSELTKSVQIASESINFLEDEIKSISSVTGKYGINLLGFKNADSVKFYHHSQSSLFIIPAEKHIRGSKSLFITLRDCMIERNKIAICYLTARRGTNPKLVYLLPAKEKIVQNVQVSSDGFHIIYLPFAEQIRSDLPLNPLPLVEPEVTLLTEKIVKKLCLKFTPSSYNNPKINQFWASIEAIALNRNEPREIDDNSNPDFESIDSRIEEFAWNFNQCMKMKSSVAPQKVSEKRTNSNDSHPQKRIKPEPNLSINEIRNLVNSGELQKMTVPNLKQVLSQLGVSFRATMKKSDLIELICDQF